MSYSVVQSADAADVQESTLTQLVDALNGVFGKQTTGRAVHARGIVVEGFFTPSAAAATLSKASHLQKTKVPVTGCFSNFAGVLNVPDTDAGASPRGLALKFHFPDGTVTDLVTHSFNGFPAPTADGFRRLLIALGTSGPGAASPTPAQKYLASHPVAKAFLESQPPPPVSYGTVSYFGVNAFRFINAAGKAATVRYRIEPVDGNHYLTKQQAASADAGYPATELTQHLAKSPARFNVSVQIAEPEDDASDPSVPWPDSRRRVDIGVLEFTRVLPDSEAQQRALLFRAAG